MIIIAITSLHDSAGSIDVNFLFAVNVLACDRVDFVTHHFQIVAEAGELFIANFCGTLKLFNFLLAVTQFEVEFVNFLNEFDILKTGAFKFAVKSARGSFCAVQVVVQFSDGGT